MGHGGCPTIVLGWELGTEVVGNGEYFSVYQQSSWPHIWDQLRNWCRLAPGFICAGVPEQKRDFCNDRNTIGNAAVWKTTTPCGRLYNHNHNDENNWTVKYFVNVQDNVEPSVKRRSDKKEIFTRMKTKKITSTKKCQLRWCIGKRFTSKMCYFTVSPLTSTSGRVRGIILDLKSPVTSDASVRDPVITILTMYWRKCRAVATSCHWWLVQRPYWLSSVFNQIFFGLLVGISISCEVGDWFSFISRESLLMIIWHISQPAGDLVTKCERFRSWILSSLLELLFVFDLHVINTAVLQL